jgi:Family of unknown function (DUF6220)
MRRAFTGATSLLGLAVVVQFFLAGSGAFDNAPRDVAFAAHRGLGYLILLLALVVTIMGTLLRVPARLVGMAGLATGLILLQPVIAGVADALDDPGVTTTAGRLVFGLHAVNGLVIVAVLGNLFARARDAGHQLTGPDVTASHEQEP